MLVIVIVDESSSPLSLTLSDDEDVSTLRQIVGLELEGAGLGLSSFNLIHNGHVLLQGSLEGNGIREGDIVMVDRSYGSGSSSSHAAHAASYSSSGTSSSMQTSDIPADVTPETLLQMTSQHPHLLLQLSSSDPPLADAIRRSDIPELRRLLMARYLAHHKRMYDSQQEMKRISENPDSEENQRMIAKRIQDENIRENMEMAIENMPEAFTQVEMLYIPCQINNHEIRAFVDSGAQTTIMSASCVERCGLTRLVDSRYSGEARGVGTGKILGRIHIAQMKLGSTFFPVSITVLEASDVEFLFGLDMLKRHRCCIDLGDNVLKIEGHAGSETIRFI